MASPTDSARTGTNITTAGTSHSINTGSPSAGDLVITHVRFAAAPGTITFAGHTQLASDSTDASDDTTNVYYRLCNGTEGSTNTLTTGNSVKLSATMWIVTGGEHPGIQPPQIAAVTIGTAANADPTTITPTGGSKDYLFITMLGMDHETATFTQPTSYVNLTQANSGTAGAVATNCMIAGASQQKTASSENPGAWTSTAATTGWTAFTVAIHPASSPTTPNSKTPWHGVIAPPRLA